MQIDLKISKFENSLTDQEKSLFSQLYEINYFDDNSDYSAELKEIKNIIDKLYISLELFNAVKLNDLKKVHEIMVKSNNLKLDIKETLYEFSSRLDKLRPESQIEGINFIYSNNRKVNLLINPHYHYVTVTEPLQDEIITTNEGNIIFYAIKFASLDIIKEILNYDIKCLDSFLYLENRACYNIATFAVMCGRLDVLKHIDNYNNQSNFLFETDSKSYTPLMCAAYIKSPEIIKYLVEEKKVDINAENSLQQTALFFAAASQSLDIIKLLIHLGANSKVIDGDKNTILTQYLSYATSTDKEIIYEAVSYFINDLKIDINNFNKDRENALTIAIQNNLLNIVTLLIQEGAETDFKTDNGDTSLMTAAKYSHLSEMTQIAKELIKANCNIHELYYKEGSSTNGYNALTFALDNYSPNIEFIKLLINKGVSVILPNYCRFSELSEEIQSLIMENSLKTKNINDETFEINTEKEFQKVDDEEVEVIGE